MFDLCVLRAAPNSGYIDQQQRQQQQLGSSPNRHDLHIPSDHLLDIQDSMDSVPLMSFPPSLSPLFSSPTAGSSFPDAPSSPSSDSARNSVFTMTPPHSTRPFGCGVPGCDDVTYAVPSDLYNHMKSMHGPGLDTTEKPYRCAMPNCAKRYKNLNGLQYHVKQANGATGHAQGSARSSQPKSPKCIEKPYECTSSGCSKRYKTMSGLEYHIAHSRGRPGHGNSPPDKPFKCNSCEKSYRNANGLVYHQSHVHGEDGTAVPRQGRNTAKTKSGGSQDHLDIFFESLTAGNADPMNVSTMSMPTLSPSPVRALSFVRTTPDPHPHRASRQQHLHQHHQLQQSPHRLPSLYLASQQQQQQQQQLLRQQQQHQQAYEDLYQNPFQHDHVLHHDKHTSQRDSSFSTLSPAPSPELSSPASSPHSESNTYRSPIAGRNTNTTALCYCPKKGNLELGDITSLVLPEMVREGDQNKGDHLNRLLFINGSLISSQN